MEERPRGCSPGSSGPRPCYRGAAVAVSDGAEPFAVCSQPWSARRGPVPEPATARVVVIAQKSDLPDDECVPIAESIVRSSPETHAVGLVGVVLDETSGAEHRANGDAARDALHQAQRGAPTATSGAHAFVAADEEVSPLPESRMQAGDVVLGSKSVAVVKRRKSFVGSAGSTPFPLRNTSGWGVTAKRGYLRKKSSFDSRRSLYPRWQRRYFIVSGCPQGSWLRYYLYNYRTGDDDIRASIDLCKVKLLPSSGTSTFTFLLEDGKIELQADSASTASDWCAKILELQRAMCE